jgi:hypothetical protein
LLLRHAERRPPVFRLHYQAEQASSRGFRLAGRRIALPAGQDSLLFRKKFPVLREIH